MVYFVNLNHIKMENYLESTHTIRFGDCDPLGHLNNARYLDYFLNAREDHLRDNYQMDLVEYYKKGKGWVVSQHELHFLRPVAVNEKVHILSGLMDATQDELLLEMIMLDEKQTQIKALLHSRFVPFNLMNGRKDVHEDEFMSFIADKLIPGLPSPLPTSRQRVEYWQKFLRATQTV